jgi:hypothetical protein
VEDRISGIEDKRDKNEKSEESLEFQKEYTRTLQLYQKTKPVNPNLGNKEEVAQDKGIHNVFNKVIAENFPDLEKKMSIQV